MKGSKEFISKSTSSDFLEQRLKSNKRSERNFDEWSLNLLPEIPIPAKILDLGCGTGKQIYLFGKFLGEKAAIFALDLSEKSLEVLKNNYDAPAQLQLLNADFEKFGDYEDKGFSKKNGFDLIYSFYALYYVENLENVINSIYDYLKPDGTFWIVSPFEGTNEEIFSILTKYYDFDSKVLYSINSFYKDVISLSEKAGFKNIDINMFKNKIIYPDEGSLIDYLKNTTFYNIQFEEEIKEDIKAHFKTSSLFKLSKNVISLKLRK